MLTNEQLDHAIVHGGRDEMDFRRIVASHRDALDAIERLTKENRRARVQVPLWRGIASAMVERARRIRCQFGGDHSMADCRCDPHQLGDAVSTMQDEFDRGSGFGLPTPESDSTARTTHENPKSDKLASCPTDLD